MMQWSPHPMHRFGVLAAGVLNLLAGALGLILALTERVWPTGWPGDALAGAVMALLLLSALLPKGRRRGRWLLVLLLLVIAVSVQLVVSFTVQVPPVGLVPSATMLAAGILLVTHSHSVRRNVVVTLEAGRINVRAKRQDLEHTLPLEAVQGVDVHRNAWARMWGYADLVAQAKKGTMAKHIDRPLVTETATMQALLGNGWDDEGRFILKAAHAYKKIKPRLEDQIRIARLPPKEREEAVLARRLQEDMEEVRL